MSNLGWYQVMTTAAKKVGGPLKLAGLVLGSGIVIGGGTVLGGQAVAKKIGKKLDEKKREAESAERSRSLPWWYSRTRLPKSPNIVVSPFAERTDRVHSTI